MLMIRMQRIGRRNDPAFRILVLPKTSSPKAGTYNDLLGTYNPKTKELTFAKDRFDEWVGKGAQVSDSLMNLLIEKKVVEGKKVSAVKKKNLEKNKQAASADVPAEASAKEGTATGEPKEEAPIVEAPVEAPTEGV